MDKSIGYRSLVYLNKEQKRAKNALWNAIERKALEQDIDNLKNKLEVLDWLIGLVDRTGHQGVMQMGKKLKVCWLSAGVSSFVAGYLAGDVDEFIYIDIDNQHPDSMRFIKDCEKVLGKKTTILKSPYGSVQNVIASLRYINGPGGAKCTEILKKRVRKKWEYEHRDYDLTYVWGYDCNEAHRANRLLETMPEYDHEFPLIEKGLNKSEVHGLLERLGIKRPVMYEMLTCAVLS